MGITSKLILSLLTVFILSSCNSSKEDLSGIAIDNSQSAISGSLCTPGDIVNADCSAWVPNASIASYIKTCNANGTFYTQSQCEVTACVNGYSVDNNSCIPSQSCQAGATQTVSCTSEIQNSSQASRINTCNANGTGYSPGSCQLISCQTGYVKSKNQCVVSTGGNQDQGPQNGLRRWSTLSLPLQISVSTELDSAERNATLATADEWDFAVADFELFENNLGTVVDINGATPANYKDSIFGIYLVNNGDAFTFFDSSPGALAVAAHYYKNSGGYQQITSGDIFVNMKNHQFGHNGENNLVDFESVILHEVGHMLGLGHSQVNPSVMRPSIGKGVLNRMLHQDDLDEILDRYTMQANASKISQLKASNEEEVLVMTELRLDGECRHYEDHQFMYSHKVDLKKIKSK